MRAPSLFQRASAEAFGTFALVTGGCGAIIVNHSTGALGHGGVAASFGLVIMVMIASLGHLSGAHFNPAVTLAFAVTRHFSWRDVPSYLAGQILGAVGGALALRAAFGLEAALGATAPVGSPLRALGIEILLTAVLMFVIVSVATDTRAVGELAAVAIGGTVALDALWGGPITGASMNPARSLGPALVAGFWPSHWIYWVGPISGALLGASLYQMLRAGSAPRD
jgi:aquaporin NIP